MGPDSAKSFPGPRLAPLAPAEDRPRARQEIDDGRRGRGYVFGAFVPATGAAMTAPYRCRTTANFVDFLEHVDAWVTLGSDHVYAVLDNLSAHRAPDVLLWAPAHPRWEFVFQPKYAAYLNLIEPWWKILRSLALQAAASTPRPRSVTQWRPPRTTGTPIATPSSGASASAAAPPDQPASPYFQWRHELAGWTT